MPISRFALLSAAFAVLVVSAASADIRFDRVGQWGGTCNAVTIRGDLAYVGIGPRLVVLDISDPQNPTRIGQTEPLGGLVLETALQGDFAYVAVSQVGLRIVDIRHSTEPLTLPNPLAPTPAYHVAVEGNLACVASYWNGFRLYEVSDPYQPVEVFRLETEFAAGGDVQFLNGHLYYSSEFRLRVFDLATPKDPQVVAEVPEFWAAAMEVRGSLIIARTDWEEISFLDVSIPASPILASQLVLDGLLVDPTIALQDDRLAVLDQRGRLISLDVADPRTPTVLSAVDLDVERDARFGAFALHGDVAWIAKPYVALSAYQLGSDGTATERGSYEEVGSVFEARVFGDNAFVFGHSGFVHWLDVSNPEQLSSRGKFGANARAIEFDGRFAFLGMANGLAIFDLSASGGPSEAARADFDVAVNALALYADVLFVTTSDDSIPWSGDLGALSVSNRVRPDWLSWSYWAPQARLKIRNERLFVHSSWFGALSAFDLSDPTAPSGVGYFPTRGPGTDFEIVGDRAYIQSSHGIDVLDITDLANIQPGGFVRHPGSTRIATNGELLFTSAELMAFGLSDPDVPQVVAEYSSPNYVDAVEVADGRLYVSAGDGGLEILSVRRRGDVNGDDQIGLEDLAGVLAAFGTCEGQRSFNTFADWNQDGCVELFDLAAILGAIE